MSELTAADVFITTRLKADATLTALIGGAVSPRIYADVAPTGVAFPLIVFQTMASSDLMVIGSARVWSNLLILCRGIAETSSWMGTLGQIESKIDAALHSTEGVNLNGIVYSCVREQPYRLAETSDGRVFRHSGGLYRIYAKAA